eukprot:12405-Heterococcus_DN1.PRE.1
MTWWDNFTGTVALYQAALRTQTCLPRAACHRTKLNLQFCASSGSSSSSGSGVSAPQRRARRCTTTSTVAAVSVGSVTVNAALQRVQIEDV